MPKTNLLRLLGVASLLCFALTARGYVLLKDDSNVYVMKWYVTPVSMQVKLPSTANLIDGNSYQSTVVAAMNAWNAQLGTVQFNPVLSSPGAYHSGNNVNEIVMDSTMDGDAFPTGVLAITLSYANSDDYAEADIIVNTAYTWDSYRGNQRPGAQDMQRVVLHELGHVLGLDHPDDFGQSVVAVMNSHASNVDRLQADDIAGAQVLYGPSGITAPANNNFANATAIGLTANRAQVTGSTIAATREAGEPTIAGSSAAHSIWWKWTASASGPVSVSTLGSNFDTVLGVFTGTNVAALTKVAENDDEESPTQNTTPTRKRTSLVNFTAVSGTTYYFAVDGWGSSSTVAAGFNGQVTLAVTFNPGAPVFVTPLPSLFAAVGGTTTFNTNASVTSGTLQWQWQLNGNPIAGATQSSLSVSAQPSATGIYTAVATATAGSTTSTPGIFGVVTNLKVVDGGSQVGFDIPHPNGNVYDQILLTGSSVAMTADAGQVVRLSFIDLTNDIVQIEFAGAGTLSLVLDGATGPAAPTNYNQAQNYMKGNAGIVIVGADETTNVSVFSVGRATAFDPTGNYNILQPISATNNPANNGSSLFVGHSTTTYDGVADLAFIAIESSNGKFGGIRAANASFLGTHGLTGIYAPGVTFTGPVFVGDIAASATATPVLRLGSAPDVRITGGDLLQPNGGAVQVSGFTQLKFVAGTTSNGDSLPAQTNRARLEQDGLDVTQQVVVNPTP